jgi:antitoxin ParD1/3/4
MLSRNVMLTENQEKLIDALVDAGHYRDANDVVSEGLRLIEERAAKDAAKLEGLREAAQDGFLAFDRGEFKEFASIDDLQAYLTGLADKIISSTAR